jgi:hypothetical protein
MIIQPPVVKYSHYGVIAAILLAMLYQMGIWIDEYHQRIAQSQAAAELRASIYAEAYQFQAAVNKHEQTLKERERLQRELEQRQRAGFMEAPRPTAAPSPPPPPPRVEDTNIPSKIQLLGMLELELSESTSWHTLLKMVVTVLVTFTGIKAINLMFRRWEKAVGG